MNFLHLIVWFKRLAWLLVIYTILRVLFVIFNLYSFQNLGFGAIGESFLVGLPFDLSAIFISNSLLTLCSLLPFRFVDTPRYQVFLKYLYWIPNIVFFWINIADFEYYKFIGRRTIFDVFGIIRDIGQQAFNLMGAYWYLLIIWGVISYLFIKGTPTTARINMVRVYAENDVIFRNKYVKVAVWVLTLGISIIVFRGGFQEKPLRINQAFSQHNNHLGNLALNTTFTFLTTIDAKGTEKVNFFNETEKQLAGRIQRARGFNIDAANRNAQPQQNVVVIILESFAREYMGYKNGYKGYTPFLDSLAARGVFYENCFANGRESIIAMPAITSAIPQLIDEPFITTSYQSNNFYGLGNILEKTGYSSSFFHAARNGSMGFEGFSQQAGFGRYCGMDQYPAQLVKRDFDNNWGIFDEPYLQYFAGELSKETKPFVSCVFTISSHHPYTIPAQYTGRFPKGTADVHESIGYTDYALRRFFETAAKQPWYKNTLFIITADHTQMNTEPAYASALGEYRVPLILFHPDQQQLNGLRRVARPGKVCQHTDIMPTILDYLHLEQAGVLPFGESVFAPTQGMALHYNSQVARLVTKIDNKNLVYFEMSADDKIKAFDARNQQEVKIKNGHVYAEKLKAFIQFYRNGLIENSWLFTD
ncbi:LTA synthase family protein [Emticicia sp. 21SJ11W-3]|uniref:LTA synthase family protein n=1 Tax=Emticicia sp. 21SJ11W-3 TaxID=2916755 RepID=UPI0020A0390C|nr:alkaline phosphatase family protein [Emticicia sp. 21SJ11W-3]UTA66307.1 sulfatase-like hydrolase/transferase [Emticicia sp. 21SJ11W-3]